MYSLYVDNGYSYSALGFSSYRDLSSWLRDHNASCVAPTVWAIDGGYAAQSEQALDTYMEMMYKEIMA